MGQAGRPTKRSPDVEERIITGLSDGVTLTQICEADDMPAPRTVRDWMEQDEEFSAAIARAREVGFDAIAEDGLRIVDKVDEDPASRRVRAEYRLKLLAKWDPKRYGELIKHGNADGSNIDMAAAIAAGNANVERGTE